MKKDNLLLIRRSVHFDLEEENGRESSLRVIWALIGYLKSGKARPMKRA